MTRPWRLGASWSSRNEKDPDHSPLVTIVEEGEGEPDEHGRREGDRLVGCMLRADADEVLELIDEAVDPDEARAYVMDVMRWAINEAGRESILGLRRRRGGES